MGTETIRRWVATDAYIKFTHETSLDLEDPDDEETLYEYAMDAASEVELSSDQVEIQERKLRNLIENRVNEMLQSYDIDDMDDWSIKIVWRWKDIAICEWCRKRTCDGDPDDCTEAPGWCDGCESYTDGNCDCVWCGHCEEWNGDCNHDNEEVSIEAVLELLQSANETVNLVVTFEAPEEETVL